MRAAGWVFLLCLPSAALADVPPAQDLASLQRPSRPMIEVAQQHYREGGSFVTVRETQHTLQATT